MEVHDQRRGRKAAAYRTNSNRRDLRGGLQNGQCNPLQAKITFDVTQGGVVAGFKALTNGDGAAAPFDADVVFRNDEGIEIGAQSVEQGVLLEWRLELTAQTASESLSYAGKHGRFDAGGNPVNFNLR